MVQEIRKVDVRQTVVVKTASLTKEACSNQQHNKHGVSAMKHYVAAMQQKINLEIGFMQIKQMKRKCLVPKVSNFVHIFQVVFVFQ